MNARPGKDENPGILGKRYDSMVGNGSDDINVQGRQNSRIGAERQRDPLGRQQHGPDPPDGSHDASRVNPFSASSLTPDEQGVFGDAKRIRAGFLYRVIDLGAPRSYRIVYDGWWFRQKIEINGALAWFQISWLTIQRRVDFKIPASIDPEQPDAALEIDFTRGLMIRRFRIWIAGQIVYDEIN